MSWIQNLCNTYDACHDIAGIVPKDNGDTLIPLCHTEKRLNFIVHLDMEGVFIRAEKNNSKICIPCTEESEGRTSRSAINKPHPLFDIRKYITYEKGKRYLENQKKWLDYLLKNPEHNFAFTILSSVHRYISKNSLIADLASYVKSKDDSFIGFCVEVNGVLEDRLWMMPEVHDAWIDYYLNEYLPTSQKPTGICYATGKPGVVYIENHPKSINRLAGNAKLISGNDKQNFTFRGRFDKSSEAVTVSYEASQRTHQTLRWLIESNNCHRCGTQAIIAWAVDHQPEVPDFFQNSYEIYDALPKTDAEKMISAHNHVFTDYSLMMREAMGGYGSPDRLHQHTRCIAVMVTDATTKNAGRLSITYYRELFENEYKEDIDVWHNTCKWYQPFEKKVDNSKESGYFIGAPSITRIQHTILGKPRSEKDASYEKLAKGLREQIIHCIFDGGQIPSSMVTTAIYRASNPLAFENKKAKNYRDHWREWEYVLSAACALVKRYYHDHKKEEFAVKLETKRDDREYLYGRLLALADSIESLARFKQGNSKSDPRATNAIRYMTIFSQRPLRTWNMLISQQLNPYIRQLNGANWYFNKIEEVKILFKQGDFEKDTALDGRYLLGFFAQRQAIWEERKNNKGDKQNEFNEKS